MIDPIPFSSLTGTATVPQIDTTVSQLFGMRNRVINGGFVLNQRAYASAGSLSAGVYAHDRWKAGAGGAAYTFTQGSAGVATTITITSGTLIQVIEGCNVPEGGTYTLSWTGTAQAKVNAGSNAVSPITVTGLTAGSNVTLEFATGTVGKVQFEIGSTATPFEFRDFGREVALCYRYYYKVTTHPLGVTLNISDGYASIVNFPVTMRTAPTLDAGATFTVGAGSAGTPELSTVTPNSGLMRNSAGNWSSDVAASMTGAFTAEI